MEINKDNFETEVTNSATPVLIDFWAPWCGPCIAMTPTIEAIEKDFENKVKVVKINVDNDPELASKFGVRAIPTLVIIKGTLELNRMVGVRTLAELKLELNKLVEG